MLNELEIAKIYTEDLFERKKCINTLTEYLKSYPNEFKVFSIHSPWGTGKTTFINLWRYHLENNFSSEFHCVYFNSWENDDSTNPLLSILFELSKTEFFTDSQEINSLFSAVGTLAKKSPKLLVKGLLGLTNFVSEDAKTKIDKMICGVIDDGLSIETIQELFKTGDDIERKLSNFNEYQIEVFKNEIKNILKEKLIDLQKKKGKKIIVFIDELDRCNPKYAVKTLEVIKHFFSMDNYYFILSWDLEQLSHSISTFYGYNMDSGGYLRRFIDLEYTLPKLNLEKYIYTKMSQNAFYNKLLIKTIKAFDFSLRDINKIANLFATSTSIKNFHYNFDYSPESTYIKYIGEILLLLKYKYPILYIKLKNKTINSQELEELKNIIKSKVDTAVIEYNTCNPNFKMLNFDMETINSILKLFLEVNTNQIITNITISNLINKDNNNITINLAKFIEKGINKLIDISIYFE